MEQEIDIKLNIEFNQSDPDIVKDIIEQDLTNTDFRITESEFARNNAHIRLMTSVLLQQFYRKNSPSVSLQ